MKITKTLPKYTDYDNTEAGWDKLCSDIRAYYAEIQAEADAMQSKLHAVRKGFSSIELLAVSIISAITITVAAPFITELKLKASSIVDNYTAQNRLTTENLQALGAESMMSFTNIAINQ